MKQEASRRKGVGRRDLILVLGGARSGKSRFALDLAGRLGRKVLFVATAEPGDEEMRQRIEKHRQGRPSGWQTLEVPRGVGKAIVEAGGVAEVVIIDCVTLLISNLLTAGQDADTLEPAEARVREEMAGLFQAFDSVQARFIVVSNEVGLGLVPDNRLGRLYRDLLGECNQALARRADEVYFLVAGLPLKVKNGRGGQDEG